MIHLPILESVGFDCGGDLTLSKRSVAKDFIYFCMPSENATVNATSKSCWFGCLLPAFDAVQKSDRQAYPADVKFNF